MLGDIRQEYQPNKDDCTNCIGQITAHFDASDQKDRDAVGTGTIYFKLTKKKYLIITAAHNLVQFSYRTPRLAMQNSKFIF